MLHPEFQVGDVLGCTTAHESWEGSIITGVSKLDNQWEITAPDGNTTRLGSESVRFAFKISYRVPDISDEEVEQTKQQLAELLAGI